MKEYIISFHGYYVVDANTEQDAVKQLFRVCGNDIAAHVVEVKENTTEKGEE